jgi:ubiquinone/menaquinone biosynthesis C-methylase UbiE
MIVEDHMKSINKDMCIDIATGTGFLAGHLAQFYKRVIGLDISDH